MPMPDLRPSPIVGTWYEANPKTLAKQIDEWLEKAEVPNLTGQITGVIAPHAGHQYSGFVAAHAFKTLQGLESDLATIISPFHNYAPYPLMTTSHQAYSTPLGNIEVDHAILEELQKNLDIPITKISNDKEHALEIELPFLQRVLKNNFKLLPIMIRAQEPEISKKLGLALAKILKTQKTIFVASTDLSHFYDQKTANEFDNEMLKRFESFNPESIFEAEENNEGFACGRAAVATTLWTTQKLGANKIQRLHYATSGNITKDYSSVVGYGACIILKTI
ncbi:MAG: AmmeMemoRadiSam system protein B [Anaerolineales bacterium]|nr:AmmeMemoRadiSam system protein B [Anaerolineales bacterium]